MPVPDICLGRTFPGSGGVAGGSGSGQASNQATGHGVSGSGLPFINVTTKMSRTLTVQLFQDLTGQIPFDLTYAAKVMFTSKERIDCVEEYISKEVTIVDAEEGIVSLVLKPDDLPYAGIWISAFSVFTDTTSEESDEPELTDEFRCWLQVVKGINHKSQINCPITIAEIRMALRDVSPEFNSLLDDLQFSDDEIAYAITRPVDEWNDTPPSVSTYTPATFPWREAWRKATCSILLKSAAYHDVRNDLAYNAGGLSVNDRNKGGQYMSQAVALDQEWKAWMMAKKKDINISLCYGSLGTRIFR